MARRKLYVPLVVDYYDDEKVIEACESSPWCEVLFTRLLAAVKHRETEGYVSPAIAISVRVPDWRTHMDELVRVGLLVEHEKGWAFPAWCRHNLSNEEIEEKRRQNRERVDKSRGKSKPAVTPEEHTDDDDGNGARNALQSEHNDATGNALQSALPLSSKQEAQSASKEANPPLPPKGRRQASKVIDLDLLTNDERSVWNHYLAARKRNNYGTMNLAKETAKVIADALTLAPIEQLFDAIDGMLVNEHNTGKGTGKTYLGIKYAIDSADRIDRHSANWRKTQRASTPAAPTRLAGRWADGGDPDRIPSVQDIHEERFIPAN